MRYLHLPRLFEHTAIAYADGSYPKPDHGTIKINLLILDDFGLCTISAQQRHDLLGAISTQVYHDD